MNTRTARTTTTRHPLPSVWLEPMGDFGYAVGAKTGLATLEIVRRGEDPAAWDAWARLRAAASTPAHRVAAPLESVSHLVLGRDADGSVVAGLDLHRRHRAERLPVHETGRDPSVKTRRGGLVELRGPLVVAGASPEVADLVFACGVAAVIWLGERAVIQGSRRELARARSFGFITRLEATGPRRIALLSDPKVMEHALLASLTQVNAIRGAISKALGPFGGHGIPGALRGASSRRLDRTQPMHARKSA